LFISKNKLTTGVSTDIVRLVQRRITEENVARQPNQVADTNFRETKEFSCIISGFEQRQAEESQVRAFFIVVIFEPKFAVTSFTAACVHGFGTIFRPVIKKITHSGKVVFI